MGNHAIFLQTKICEIFYVIRPLLGHGVKTFKKHIRKEINLAHQLYFKKMQQLQIFPMFNVLLQKTQY